MNLNRSSLHIDRCKYAKNNFLLKIIIKKLFLFLKYTINKILKI